jgi:THO complex subunit 6
MVCGGSMAPSIYRLTSTNKITSLSVPPNVVTQAAIFAKDRIITAGSECTIRHWAVNGEALAAVPGGHLHNFSLAHNTHHKSKQYEVLTVCGDSSDIHVFTDFGYRAFSLNIT